jgi:hypothetical protein
MNSILTDPIQLNAYQIDLKNKIVLELTGGLGIDESNQECSFAPQKTTTVGFFNRVKELVDLDQVNADQPVLVTETMPDLNLFQDPDHPEKELSGLVLTTVLRREPGTLSGGNQPFSSKRQDTRPKMIRRVIKNDPNKPGEITFIISKWFDNLVGLNVCARTNKRADELADWFEDLMEKNRWFFEINGFNKVLFKGRMADLRKDDSTTKISFRPMKYYFRTETFYTITEQQLNRMIVQLTTGTNFKF